MTLRCRRDIRGFTIVELVVVMAIIAILLGIATLYFSQMVVKNGIESQTRQLLTDLQTARAQALFSKRPTTMTFQPASYKFRQYSSVYETVSSGTTVTSTTVKRQMSLVSGDALSGTLVLFDAQGVAEKSSGEVLDTPITIRVNPTGSGAVYDCVIIDSARSTIGGMANGSCVPK